METLRATLVPILATIGAIALLVLLADAVLNRHRHHWRVLATRTTRVVVVGDTLVDRTADQLLHCRGCQRVRPVTDVPLPVSRTTDLSSASAWEVMDLLDRHDFDNTQRGLRTIRGWLGQERLNALEAAGGCGEPVRGVTGSFEGYCASDYGHEGGHVPADGSS